MWLWLIFGILIGALVGITIYTRKKEKPVWDRMPEIRKEILKATTKEQLISLSEELKNSVKGSSNEYLVTTVNTLILVIKDRIELDFNKV